MLWAEPTVPSVIRVAVVANAPPYSYYEGSEPMGSGVELLKKVTQDLGIQVQWVYPNTPLPELEALLETKQIDMIAVLPLAMGGTLEALYSQPVSHAQLVIVVPQKHKSQQTLQELAGRRVATLRYSVLGRELRQKLPRDTRIMEFATIEAALAGVSQGEADACVTFLESAEYGIKKHPSLGLKITPIASHTIPLAMAIRSDGYVLKARLHERLGEYVSHSKKGSPVLKRDEARECASHYHGFFYLAGGVSVAGLIGCLLLYKRILFLKESLMNRQFTVERLERHQKETSSFLRIVDENAFLLRTDPKGYITYISNAYARFLGWEVADLIGHRMDPIRHPDTPRELFKQLWVQISAGLTWEGEIQNRKRNGEPFWVLVHIVPVLDEGKIVEFQASMQDISAHKKMEKMAIQDALTLLYNRRHFNEIFPTELRRNRRESKSQLICIIDVDYFKKYNDTYGHPQGDFVLQAIGDVLNQKMRRPTDFAFRLGGEEFGLLVNGQTLEEARVFLESIRQAIRGLRITHEKNLPGIVTVTMGALNMSDPDPGLERYYYQKADALLYQAKEAGRDQVVIEEM